MRWQKISSFIVSIILIAFIVLLLVPSKNTKEYKDNQLSFTYSSKYKIKVNDNYIELSSKKSKTLIETRNINTIENSASFTTIMDNVIFNYLEHNPNYKLVSKYENYQFNDSRAGARLIFENVKDNRDSIILLIIENLKVVMITMTAESNEFYLHIDSTELIMNTLKFFDNQKYISVETKYPEEDFIGYENRNEKEISLNDQVKSYEIYDSEYLIKTNIPTDLDQITISSKYGYFDNDQMRITYSIDDYQFIYDESTDFYKDFSEYKVNHGYKKYKDKIYYVKWQSYKLSNRNYYQEIMTLTYPITNNKYLSIKIITYGYKMSDEIINAALNYELELTPHSSINNGYINGHIIHNVNEDDDYKKVSEISRIKIEYSIPEKYNFTRDYNSMEITKNDINVSVNISKITQSNYDEIYNESSINYFENYKVEDQGSININDIVYEKYLESYTSFSSNYEIYHYVAKLSEDYKLYIVYQKKSDSNISADDLMKEILNFKITRIGESG